MKLAESLDGMQPSFAKMHRLLTQTETALNQSSDAIEQTADILRKTEDRIDGVSEDLSALSSAAIYTSLRQLADGSSLNTDEISQFISSPVNVKTVSLYPVKNYGTAMTPFYTNLALWVSGIVLISVLKMEVDRDERLKNLTASQAYFRTLDDLYAVCLSSGSHYMHGRSVESLTFSARMFRHSLRREFWLHLFMSI